MMAKILVLALVIATVLLSPMAMQIPAEKSNTRAVITLPPTVSINYPDNDTWIKGTVGLNISYQGATEIDTSTGETTSYQVDWLSIKVDGVEVKNYTSGLGYNGSVNYSWDTTQFSDCNHTVKAMVESHSQTATDTKTYHIDNTPPSPQIVSPADGSYVGGIIQIEVETTENCSGFQKAELYIDGNYNSTNTSNPSIWSINTTKYSDGNHQFYVIAYDNVNNTGQSSTVTYYFDNTPPSVSFSNPSDGDVVNGTVSLTVSASDSGSGIDHVSYYNDSIDSNHLIGSSTDGNSNYQVSWDTTLTSDGSHTLYAVAYDKAGNSQTTSITVTVDNSPPYVSITSPSKGSWVSGAVLIQVSASDSNSGIDKVEFYVDNVLQYTATSSPYEWTWPTSSWSDGQHTVKVIAYNGAGETSEDSATYNVDNTPPSISVNSPASGSWVNGIVNISATASDSGSGVKNMTITIQNIGQVALVNGTSIYYNWDTTTVADGDYIIWINSTDNVGNKATQTITVHVDNSPPQPFDLKSPPNKYLTNSKTIDFEWNATTDSGVGLDHYILHVYNSTWYQNFTSTSNSTSQTLNVNDGTYYWYVVAVDKLGNERQSNETWNFTIDTTGATFSANASLTYFSPNGDGYYDTDTISAQTNDGSTVNWYLVIQNSSGSTVRTYNPPNASSFSWTWDGKDSSGAVLPDGQYNVIVYAEDNAGNNNTQTVVVYIDNTPPDTFTKSSVDNQGNNSILANPTPTFYWSNSPSDSLSGTYQIRLYISNTPDWSQYILEYNLAAGTVSYKIPDSLADGTYYWWVVALDNVYNGRLADGGAWWNGTGWVTHSDYWVFTVDTTPPNITSASATPYWFSPNGDGYHDTLYLNASSDEEVDWDVQIYLASNGSEAYNFGIAHGYTFTGTYNSPLKWGDGEYYVVFKAIDEAGNMNSTTVYFVQDTTPMPVPTIIQPTANSYLNTTSVIFEWDNPPADNSTNAWWKDVITVYNDSGVVYTNTLTTRGSSYMLAGTTLPDGTYYYVIYRYDKAGNVADTGHIYFTVDTIPPTRPTLISPPNNELTNATLINFTWSASQDATPVTYTLNIYYPGNVLWKSFTTTNTWYVVNVSAFQTTQTLYWNVSVKDSAGNTNISADTYTLIIDHEPPTFIYSISEHYISPNGDGVQDTTTIHVESTSNANETLVWNFTVYNSGGSMVYSYQTSSYSSTYDWTWNGKDFSGAVVPDGNYTIVITGYDQAGNPAKNQTWVVVDTVPPSPPHISAPANNSYLNSSSVTITWTWNETTNISNSKIYIYNSTGLYLSDNLTLSMTSYTVNLPDDSYYVYISITDIAGNTNYSNTVHFVVDTTPPAPFDLVAPANNTYTNTTTITFSWNETNDANFYEYVLVLYFNGQYTEISINDIHTTTYTYTFPQGEYNVTWYVLARDKAYNERQSNETFTLHIDTVAPRNVSPVAPSGLQNSTADITFQWTSADDLFFSHYHFVLLQNGTVIYETNTTATNITLTLGDGNYSWYVEAIDMAGNVNATSPTNFFVDTHAPVVTGYTPKQYWNSTVPIWINATDGNGTGVQYIYVYYTYNGGAWILYNKYYGNTTYVELTFSNAGFYQIALVGEDYAGHKEQISADLSITIDKSPPSGSITLDNGATYTANGTVLVNLTFQDDYGVQYYRYRIDGGAWTSWIKINATTSGSLQFWLTLPHTEGNHTVDVEYMDMANNTSPIYSDGIKADLYAPIYQNGNITPYYSGDGNATVWLNATDNISDVAWIYYSFDGTTWTKIAYSNHFNISYALAEGKIYVYIILQDNVGHNSSTITLNYTVDLTPPYGSLGLNSTYNTVNITIYLNATDNITWVVYFRYKIDNGAWSDWIAYTSQYVIDVQTSGTHTIYVQYMDKVGHVSATYQNTTVVSTTPPTVDFTVHNATANNTIGYENITINITATSDAGLKQMRIVVVDDSGVVIFDSGWIDYADNYTFRLTATGYYNITVYVRDKANNEANTTHEIYLDLDAPTIKDIQIENYLIFNNSENITINATDFSGISAYGYAINGTFIAWFSTNNFIIELPNGEANYTITIYVKDIWGHVATADTWIYEVRHRPTGSISVDTHLTNNATITLHLSASDSVFTVVGMYVKIDNGAWKYYDYATTLIIQISTDGNHTVYVKYVTNIGVNSTVYQDWIMVDTAPPTTQITSHLPQYTNATSITFTVSGTDTLSGFAYYKVYISINGGAWQYVGTYLANQTTVSITFSQEGTYQIAIVGYDKAGNHEDITVKATVIVDWTKPKLNVLTQNTTLTTTFSYTISWNATDNDGIAYYLIYIYRTPLTKGTPWKTINTTSTSATITFEDNSTYTIIIYAYDLAGNFVEKSLTIVENYNYPPEIKKTDIPQNTTAGQETTFYADAVDIKGDNLNYTWILDNKTVGYGQYLKIKLPAGNHTLVLVVSDGVHNVTKVWHITAKKAPVSSTSNAGGLSGGFPWWIIVIFVLLALLVLVILVMKRKKPEKKEEEEGLTEDEMELLNSVKDYLDTKGGSMEYKKLVRKIAQLEEVEPSDVEYVINYAVAKGILAKEVDDEGITHILLVTKNVEYEKKEKEIKKEGGKEE